MDKGNGKRPIVSKGEPTQRTKQGLEIPIPTSADLEEALKRVSKRGRGKREKPSRSG
jgi:hypothetical protein